MADFRTGPARKVNTAAGRGFKYVQCTCSGVSTALRTELGALNYDMAGLEHPFKYSTVTCWGDRHNNIQEEINKRILNSNKCYFAMIHLFKSKYLTRTTKVRLYKTLIKPVLTYGSETWVLTEHDKSRLAVFERKILRKVYGPVKENGEWRLRYNREIYELYNSPDIVTDIKIGRLRWAGHIQRMKTSEMVRKIMETKPEGRRKAGRPNLRWMDGILQDVKSLRLKNWWMVARDREAWRRTLREALTHPGLLSR
mgnify:CR=1 FL=1